MAARKGYMSYILLNEDNGTYETFESRAQLMDFLEDEEFSKKELRELQVIGVSGEYKVTPSFELEEVE